MNMLVQAGLDYDVVEAELGAQIDRLDDDQFATFANEALVELEERYGMTTPIEEVYVLPQFGDWPFAFTRFDAVYV